MKRVEVRFRCVLAQSGRSAVGPYPALPLCAPFQPFHDPARIPESRPPLRLESRQGAAASTSSVRQFPGRIGRRGGGFSGRLEVQMSAYQDDQSWQG